MAKKPANSSVLRERGVVGDGVADVNAATLTDLTSADNNTPGLQTNATDTGESSNAALSATLAPVATSMLPDSALQPMLFVNDTADHVINAAEASSVGFTVSGLNAGAGGTVAFIDASHHQVVVNVAGNGNYAADLSTLTDGAITSSLSVTDGAGHAASATGNPVSLDTDRDLDPTISVNAADPSHVTFTIAGLEGDETGTMTFTDQAGQQAVVNIGSNGTYTTDLSNLARGPLTYLMSVTDPAGNAIAVDPVVTLGDGSANAAGGSPQVPHLLDGYATRPTWMVAGVDYAVGIQNGTVLKSPTTLNMSGVSIDTVNHLIRVTGNNVTLDGYNFTGWSLYVYGGAQNTTVKNCNFFAGTGIYADPTTANVSVLYCKFDGTGADASTSTFVTLNGTGTKTVQYCWLENAPQHFLELNCGGGTVNYSYNLIENGGTASGQHLNVIQFLSGTYTNAVISNNTIYQTFQASGGELIQIDGYQQGATVVNARVSNNTLIAVPSSAGAASVSYMIDAQSGPTRSTATTGTVQNNYMANAHGGAFGFFYPMGVNAPNVTFAGNIDMATGKSITADNTLVGTGSTGTALAPPTIASFSPDSNVIGDAITNATVLTLTGTAAANSTVKVFDGATQIGTVTANASGGWSLATAALANGAHGFTATATQGGTTSAVSTTLAVRVDTVAPAVPVITGDTINGVNQAIISGTAEANSSIKVFDGQVLLGSAVANASGAWTYTTGQLSVGAHAFRATSTDAAGNTGAASAALTTTVTAAVTAAPTINSFSTDSNIAGDRITNDSTLTLSGTAPANCTVKIFDGTTQVATATANAGGAWSTTTAALADGDHRLTAKADVGGNISAPSAVLSVKIDTVAPNAPTIAAFSPDSGAAGDGITNTNIVTLTGTAEANSTVKLFDGTIQIGTATATAGGAWTYTTGQLASTTHQFTATASDAAGNSSARSAALSVTVQAAATGQNAAGQNLVANGGFETGDYSGWTLGGHFGTSIWGPQTYIVSAAQSGQFAAALGPVGADGTLSQDLQTTLGQHYTVDFWLANGDSGPNDFTVKWNGQTLLALVNTSAQGYTEYTYNVVGAAGSSHLEFDFRQDPSHWSLDNVSVKAAGAQAPTAPTIALFSTDSNVVGDGITNANALTLTGTAAANSTVRVFDGATQIGTATANANGAWSFTANQLSNATHQFTAKALDAAGNVSPASAAVAVTVDTVAPNAPTIISFAPNSGTVGDGITNASVLTLTGTAEANSTLKVLDGATQIGTATTNANGTWTFVTATLAGGSHSFTTKAMDAAGNNSAASAPLTVVVDTIAPAAPTIVSFSTDSNVVGDGITSANVLMLSGRAQANSTVKVMDGSTQIGTASANANGAWTFATATLANGVHSFTAKAMDAAGNSSAASAPLFAIVDTQAPSAPVVTGDTISGTNQVTLSGTAEANSTLKVFDGTTLLGTAIVNDNGTWIYTTATLSNGLHVFTGKATDVAGNTSAPSPSVSVLVGANAPTITAFSPDSNVVGDRITDATVLTLTGTAAANSAIQVFDGTTRIGTTTANGSGSWTYTTASLVNGAHRFTATSTNAAGDTSAASAVLTITVDTTAPSAPTIASFSADSHVVGDGITNARILTLTGTAEANSTVNVFDGTAKIGTTSASASGAWSFTTGQLSNAGHQFTTTATDAAGNTSATSAALHVKVDTVAPGAPVITAFSPDRGITGDGVTNASAISLTGTAEANSTVKVFDGSTSLGTAAVNASGAWSFVTDHLSNAVHQFTATATDAAGNSSATSAARDVKVDTVAPSAPVITAFSPDSGATGDGVTNAKVISLTGTAEPNSMVNVFDGSTSLGTAAANASGRWSFISAALADGSHRFSVKATDSAGNTSPASAALAITIDAAAPIGPKITAYSTDTGTIGDGITNDNTLTLTGTAAAGSTLKVFDGATQIGSATANSSGVWSCATTALADGIHSFRATASDAAGNSSAASAALSVTVDTHAPSAPVLSSFSANSGNLGDAITNDNTLTLSGLAAANSSVKVFDGAKLLGSVTANANGLWDYTSAALADGHHSFTATASDVAGNSSALSSALAVMVDTVAPNAPTINSFSPDSGALGDGLTNAKALTLTGTAEANSTLKVFDGAALLGATTANASGAWSYATAALADGSHGFTVRATDAAGNTSVDSTAFTVTVDTHSSGGFTLIGTSGADALLGGPGNDTLIGLGGADHLNGGPSADTMIGGPGNDVFIVDNPADVVKEAYSPAFTAPPGWTVKGSADFNGDGQVDVALTNGSVNQIWLLKDGAVMGSASLPAYAGYAMSGIADVNGDGHKDVLYQPSGGGGAGAGTEYAVYLDGVAQRGQGFVGGITPDAVQALTGTNDGVDTVRASIDYALPNGVENLTLTGSANINGSGNALNNVIAGNPGNNVLTGGGASDTFVFAANFGKDVITDFHPAGAGQDVIQFSASTFDTFAAVLAHAAQSGQDVVIAADPNNTVTLKNIQLAALHQNDFHFG